MDPIRIGVVGYGHLGKHHARLLHGEESCELVAIADSREDALKEAGEKYPVELVQDYRELLGKVDAVSVVVPTQVHREVAGFFLENGVDVLVEKPLTPDVATGLELVELGEKHDRVFQVGHVERFNPAYVSLVEKGFQPRYIESQRIAPFTFRSTDVSVVLDLMIHDIDLVLALVRSPIKSVDAFGGAVFTAGEDMASATLKFENGTVAHLAASRVAMKPGRKMRVFSPEGYASIDFQDPSGVVIRKNEGWDIGKLDVDNVDMTKIENLWKYVFEGLLSVEQYEVEQANPLLDELVSFLSAVRTREEPVVSGRAGLAAVEVAHRVLDAIRAHPW